MESNTFNVAKRADETQTNNTPVDILIHSFRHRLADPDGLCSKYVIDAIVKAGLLEDDSTKFVKEVRFKQTKIPKGEEEYTEVEII